MNQPTEDERQMIMLGMAEIVPPIFRHIARIMPGRDRVTEAVKLRLIADEIEREHNRVASEGSDVS